MNKQLPQKKYAKSILSDSTTCEICYTLKTLYLVSEDILSQIVFGTNIEERWTDAGARNNFLSSHSSGDLVEIWIKESWGRANGSLFFVCEL